ncbi:Ig-like domain-containing protein, partial [Caballeronia sp.]|uniref:Ig-like domain-containing protein n=1 Tax=Caballeronia sp. TaxID=1931223 RepID=UPI003C55BB55
MATISPSKAVITSVGGATGGGTSSSAQPVITGTATAGTYVNVYDGVRLIGTATVAANGTWSFTAPASLKGGTHSFTAIDVGSDGSYGTSSTPMSVIIPSGTPVVPPQPVINGMTDDQGHPLPNPTNDPHPSMNGTGTPGDTITMYDGNTPIGSTIVGPDGKWVVKPTTDLSNGTHDIYVIETNPAGVPSVPSDHTSVIIDTKVPATPAAPVLTDGSGNAIPAGSATSDGHPHISGTGGAGDKITVYDNGTVIGSTTVGPDGKWSYTPTTDLSNGTHSITVIDTNAAGAPSTPSTPIVIKIDTSEPLPPAAPTLTDDSGHAIPSGSTTSDGHPHISGTRSVAGNTITVWDGLTVLGTATVAANGTWTFTPSKDLS